MPDFTREIEIYTANKQRLITEGLTGQFVLISGDQIIGVFPSQEKAYETGLQKFGNVAMFIKQIVKDEPTQSTPALMLGVLNARF